MHRQTDLFTSTETLNHSNTAVPCLWPHCSTCSCLCEGSIACEWPRVIFSDKLAHEGMHFYTTDYTAWSHRPDSAQTPQLPHHNFLCFNGPLPGDLICQLPVIFLVHLFLKKQVILYMLNDLHSTNSDKELKRTTESRTLRMIR